MSSTYSPDLRIELIGTGDQAGVWGNTTNTNLGTLMENAIAGYTSVSIIASPQALTANDGALDEARFAAVALTTTTSANFTVCIPPNSKLYTFYNASSYTATITNSTVKNGIIASGGTTVAIPAGKTMSLWSDGTNVAQQTNHLISPSLVTPALGTPASGTLTNATGLPLTTGVTGTLPVANGGTGVTSSTGTGNVVLSNSPTLVTPALGTPSSGTLTNATGLPLTTGVTGVLPIANGGTNLSSTPTNGQIPVGNGTGYALATITAGTGVSVTNGSGSITVANTGVTSVNGSTGAVTTMGWNVTATNSTIGNGGTYAIPSNTILITGYINSQFTGNNPAAGDITLQDSGGGNLGTYAYGGQTGGGDGGGAFYFRFPVTIAVPSNATQLRVTQTSGSNTFQLVILAYVTK
jgi:hypothetical protein